MDTVVEETIGAAGLSVIKEES
jgi:hypothetical protein